MVPNKPFRSFPGQGRFLSDAPIWRGSKIWSRAPVSVLSPFRPDDPVAVKVRTLPLGNGICPTYANRSGVRKSLLTSGGSRALRIQLAELNTHFVPPIVPHATEIDG